MIKFNIDPKLKIKKLDEVVNLPEIVVVNEFNEKAAKEFRNDFAKAVNTGQKIIPVVIDSYGGEVYSLLSMVSTIKQSPVPVATIGTGKMMSCGAVLFTCGVEGHRYIDPFSTLLIHDVSAGAFGKVEDIKTKSEEIERLNQMIYVMMARNIGKPEDYFLKLTHDNGHADLYFSAEQCKEHNLANHIRTPNFNVKLSTEITLRNMRKEESNDQNEEPLMVGLGSQEPPMPRKKRNNNSNKTTKEERQALRDHIDDLDKLIKQKQKPQKPVKTNAFIPGSIVELEQFDPARTKGKVVYVACRLALPSIKECNKKECKHTHKNFIWVAWQDGSIFSYRYTKLRMMTAEELQPKIGRELSGKIGQWTYDAIKKVWKRDGDNREYTNDEFNDIIYFEQHPDAKEEANDFLSALKKEQSFH